MKKYILTKSIFKKKEKSDGLRVSIMSRHTENDGTTADLRIVEGVTFDEWLKVFAPPGRLVGAYYKKEIEWEEFSKKYLEFLRSEEIKIEVKNFSRRCLEEVITVMCVEDIPEKCHRRILAEELARHQPELLVVHN